MEIKLDEITTFFGDFRNAAMPQSLRELILKRGDKITLGNLETTITDFKTLKKHLDKEAIRKINRSARKESFPVIRIGNTPVYFAYNPRTGDYLGGYSVEDEGKEEKFLSQFDR